MTEQMEALERDYPELLDKLVLWKNGKLEYIGRVIGCDYHIGVTIVNEDDHRDYLTCRHGPLSKMVQDDEREGLTFDQHGYREKFHRIIKSIILENYDVSFINGFPVTSGPQPSSTRCSFNQ